MSESDRIKIVATPHHAGDAEDAEFFSWWRLLIDGRDPFLSALRA